jgi:hypothetical protein
MLKLPVFKIIPLINSYYIEQVGNRRISVKEYRSVKKSINRLKKSISDPLKWIYLEGKETPVLMKKSGDENIFLTGTLRLKKAKTEKDLEYWKKKLMDVLRMGKSLEEILFPGVMVKSLPERTQELLIKARAYPIGTKRTWSGKEYKKVAGGPTGKGKWVRTYSETQSRGAKQAIRNVQKKIMEAKTMEELLEIVQQNSARFQDKDGKMLPIVKEFLSAARGTDPGKKEKPEEAPKEEKIKEIKPDRNGYFSIDEDEAQELVDSLNDKAVEGVEFYFNNEDGDIEFIAEVERDEFNEHIRINPFDYTDSDNEKIKSDFLIKDAVKEEPPATKEEKTGQEKLDVMMERMGGKEKVRDSLLATRKKESRLQDIDDSLITTEENIKLKEEVKEGIRQTDKIISSLKDYSGLSEEEVLNYLGIRVRGKDKKKRKTRADKGMERKVEKELDEAYDPTLDPSSPEYRYKDTGYIAGSRKELAAEQIRTAKKDGRTVKKRELDWAAIEENPREAKQLIVKSNLFGKVDWDMLKEDGITSGAGFLIDRVYASIAKEPEDNALARQDYTYGIESIRERMERCKTPDDVTNTLNQIKEEYEGVMMDATSSEEYEKLGEELYSLIDEVKVKEKKAEELANKWLSAGRIVSKLKYERDKRERRGWKPKPELEKEYKEAVKEQEIKREEWDEYREKFPESRWDNKTHPSRVRIMELRKERRDVLDRTIKENLESNPYTRAWRELGSKFLSVVNYRSYNGSKSFKNHVTNAKFGKYDNWSWAEKKGSTVKKANKAAVKFQLKVAENYNRKGGRKINVKSTQELKDQFNLREVQSGNWVLRDPVSAKFHVEKSAEAFSDLADITGVPDDKISFNGRLAMAFGARGKGNAGFGGAAKAHYEPIERVVNLTKMGGGGSLAHEWFHAMDNLLSEAYGSGETKSDDFLSENPMLIKNEEVSTAYAELIQAMNVGEEISYKPMAYSEVDFRDGKANFENPRTEFSRALADTKDVEEAMNLIDSKYDPIIEKYETYQRETDYDKSKRRYKRYQNKAIKQRDEWKRAIAAFKDGKSEGGTVKIPSERGISSFKKGANDLDIGKNGTYWSTGKEMAARAFAAYTEDRLSEQNRQNDYLAVYSDNKYYKDPLFGDTFPYPEGEERTRINKAFDKLFAAIKNSDAIQKALEEIIW